jgi:hypothetical protein
VEKNSKRPERPPRLARSPPRVRDGPPTTVEPHNDSDFSVEGRTAQKSLTRESPCKQDGFVQCAAMRGGSESGTFFRCQDRFRGPSRLAAPSLDVTCCILVTRRAGRACTRQTAFFSGFEPFFFLCLLASILTTLPTQDRCCGVGSACCGARRRVSGGARPPSGQGGASGRSVVLAAHRGQGDQEDLLRAPSWRASRALAVTKFFSPASKAGGVRRPWRPS